MQTTHPTVKAHWTSINPVNWAMINLMDRYKGCAHHYNQEGHAVLVKDILPTVKSILGW
jgi:hypothetical protein